MGKHTVYTGCAKNMRSMVDIPYLCAHFISIFVMTSWFSVRIFFRNDLIIILSLIFFAIFFYTKDIFYLIIFICFFTSSIILSFSNFYYFDLHSFMVFNSSYCFSSHNFIDLYFCFSGIINRTFKYYFWIFGRDFNGIGD